MSEHTPVPQPAPAAPEHSPAVAATSPTRRRARRGAVVAVALVAAVGAGGFSVGIAAGREVSTTSTSAPQTSQTTQQSGQSGQSQQVQPPSWGQDQQQGQQGQLGGSTSASETTTPASSDQLTGLVRIVSTMSYDGGTGVGTGMVLDSDGEIVTNHHVVAGATKISVTVMSTGTTYAATVVGSDSADDVAVLQLQGASGLKTITSDTDGVTVNEPVTAVGDGNGLEQLSAAAGTVMATGQQITTQAEVNIAGEKLHDLIEISSDVVPGYSGGATYDADGEVVGMTTAASTGTGSDTTGYAVPIATVLRIADDLEGGVRSSDYTYGYPAFLGIGLDGSTTTVQGVYEGTPAADAGLGQGDTITRVDGTRVATAAQLRAAIAAHAVGDRVRITWTDAAGTSHIATITLAKGPVA